MPQLRVAPHGQPLLGGAGGMKGWLLDQNLPARLTFTPVLPVIPATSLSRNPTDSVLWDHARENELAIVTKDADFSGRIILQTPPPWIVHLRFGNLRRREFHAVLAWAWPQLEALLPAHKLVNVYADRVEAVG
jgi:predicted nuclease of predicted toxin-antitoxin system